MTLFVRIIFLVFLQLLCTFSYASSPESGLRKMLESDMLGNPSVRIDLVAPQAYIQDLSGNKSSIRDHDVRVGYFDLDSAPLELATNWQLEKKTVSCSPHDCTLSVIFRVVATTTGMGTPSWKSAEAREIVLLNSPMERHVKFHFKLYSGKWRLLNLPVPYVKPETLKQFFKNEVKQSESIVLPANADERALKNRDVIQVWRLRQINTLEKLFP